MMSDVKFALRSLTRVKGLAVTVVLTLALGIGANAAIFSIVRGVLLRPLVNKDEAHLIYIRQSAPGIGSRRRRPNRLRSASRCTGETSGISLAAVVAPASSAIVRLRPTRAAPGSLGDRSGRIRSRRNSAPTAAPNPNAPQNDRPRFTITKPSQ